MTQQILVIEDDLRMQEMIMRELVQGGFTVTGASDGTQGLEFALAQEYVAIVCDVNLPGVSGFDVCSTIKRTRPRQPLLLLTSRTDELDKVLGLELGADDYITKPFSPREFIARIRALIRRSQVDLTPRDQLKFGALVIDGPRRRVQMRGEPMELTAIEFDLLYFLASNAGRPFTRDDLMEHVWGYHSTGFEPTVTTQLSRLRAKIEPDPARPTYIKTVRGVGYRFVETCEL